MDYPNNQNNNHHSTHRNTMNYSMNMDAMHYISRVGMNNNMDCTNCSMVNTSVSPMTTIMTMKDSTRDHNTSCPNKMGHKKMDYGTSGYGKRNQVHRYRNNY